MARAASTGGGRTYRGQKPVNFYAALVLIVVVGAASLVYSRHEYQVGAATSTTPPAVGTTWYAAYDVDICGAQQPGFSITANIATATTKSTASSFSSTGNGVIKISPKTASVAGKHATLGRFFGQIQGFSVTATAITLPSAASTTATSTTTSTTGIKVTSKKKKKNAKTYTYKNGDVCAKGTPDAGKKGVVEVAYWTNAFNSKGKAVSYHGNLNTLPFTNNQLVTIAFLPAGKAAPKPSGTIVSALVTANTGSSSTAVTPTTAASTSGSTSSTSPTSSTSTSSTVAPGANITTTTSK